MKIDKLIYVIFACVGIYATSCSDSTMEEEYYDPEKSTTTKIEYIFTNLEVMGSYRWTYWDMGTMVLSNLAVYAQTCGYSASNSRFEQNSGYNDDRWRSFYQTMAHYKEMEILLREQAEEDIPGYEFIIQLGKAVMIHEAQRATDLWGDMPFSEAATARDLEKRNIYPAYDTQESIYTYMLDELKNVNTAITNWKSSSYAKKSSFESTLARQDVIFKGDIDLWQKFVNSLRLRVAMRISYVKEAEAKSVVQEILGSAANYPVIDKNTENALIKAAGPDLFANTNTHENGLQGAFDWQSGKNYASGLMSQAMITANDPRTLVYFSRTKYGTVMGLDPTLSENDQTSLIQAEAISRFDTTTIWRNDYVPHILMTASEMSFIKAEAYERWGGGDAQASYEQGIRQSIEFWYSVQALNPKTEYKSEPLPTEAEIQTLLTATDYAYGSADHLKKIGTQKWIHFNVLLTYDAWAEQRRTGYPELPAETAGSIGEYRTRSVRLTYPVTEKSYNPVNYEAVKSKDTPNTKIWWHVK